MLYSGIISDLITAFQCFPGVGVKSAQRMVMHILTKDRNSGEQLSNLLFKALSSIKKCKYCNMLTENDECDICINQLRDNAKICVVHYPSDVLNLEKLGIFTGKYFVLHGSISPVNGVDEISLDIPKFIQNVKQNSVKEIILALNSNLDGEITSYYISKSIEDVSILITKLAQGIPNGGDLDFIDANTLSIAFNNRQSL